jgi:hypothetical protein
MIHSDRHTCTGAARLCLIQLFVAFASVLIPCAQTNGAPIDAPFFVEHQDVGPVGIPGNAEYDSDTGVFTIEASGADIWNTTDQFHYLFGSFSGNLRLTATLKWEDQDTVNASVSTRAKLGIMLRENSAPGSRHVFGVLTSGNNAHVHHRANTEGVTLSAGSYATSSDTLTMRVTRLDNHFTFEVMDGDEWLPVRMLEQEMPSQILWGIACCSHNNSATAVGKVSDLEVVTIPGGVTRVLDAYTYSEGRPVNVGLDIRMNAPSTEFTTIEETVPAGWNVSDISHGGSAFGNSVVWNLGILNEDVRLSYRLTPDSTAGDKAISGLCTMNGISFPVSGNSALIADPPLQPFDGPVLTHHADIGNPCLAGMAGYEEASATWTNSASGAGIGAVADQFHFAFAETQEDYFRISGKLIFPNLGGASIGAPDNPEAKIGLMIRDNLSDASAQVMGSLSASRGGLFQYRTDQDSQTREIDPDWKTFDMDPEDPLFAGSGHGYIRLTKFGTTFGMEYKTEVSDPWKLGGACEVDMGEGPIYWGVAVTASTSTEPEACDPATDLVYGHLEDLVFENIRGSSSRTMDSLFYLPEFPIAVSVSIALADGNPQAVLIVENIPLGWDVSDISHGGKRTGKVITWNLGPVGETTVSYLLVPPASTAGAQEEVVLSGIASIGGTVVTTQGDHTLGPPAGMIVVPRTLGVAPLMDGVINEAEEYSNAAYFEYDTQDSTRQPGWYQPEARPETYPGDFAGQVWMQYDSEYLWVAFRVSDDVVQPSGPSTDVWRRDSSEIYLDANLSRSSPKEGTAAGFQASAQADGSRYGGNGINAQTGDGAFWSARGRVVDDHTWEVEYRVSLAETGLKPGDMAGFDIAINDCDDEAPSDVRAGKHWWWTSGSDSWNNEALWGLILLEGTPADEAPVITDIGKVAEGIEIRWTSQEGFSYSVMARDTMDEAWEEIGSVNGVDGAATFVDEDSTAQTKFYIILKHTPPAP